MYNSGYISVRYSLIAMISWFTTLENTISRSKENESPRVKKTIPSIQDEPMPWRQVRSEVLAYQIATGFGITR